MKPLLDISGIKGGSLKALKPILLEWINLTNQEKWFFEEDAHGGIMNVQP